MPVWPGATPVVHGECPGSCRLCYGCMPVTPRRSPGGAPVTSRWHDRVTINDKTRTKLGVRSFLFSLIVMSSKKKPARNVVQECPDRISASKKKTAKKAMPVEEPSSDDDTAADRVPPSAMPLKKNIEKMYTRVNPNFTIWKWAVSHTVYHGTDPVEPRTFPVWAGIAPASPRFNPVFDILPGSSRFTTVELNILKQPGTRAGSTRFIPVRQGSPRCRHGSTPVYHGLPRITEPGWTGVSNRHCENAA